MFRFGTALSVISAGLVLLVSAPAHARGGSGGEVILGVNLGLMGTPQEHMNTLITRANTREGGISTPALNNAYEGAFQLGYRFSGSMIAMMLRPSYFYQRSTGSATSGSFNYSVTGFTVFPMLRLYPLENDFMKFFMQFGIGFGRANSSIEEGTAKVEAVGNSFGTIAGLGAEFCYVGTHCMSLEGNYRYLTMERNVATSSAGTFATNSLSQATENHEVEMDDTDLAVRMSGLQFMLGYSLHF